MMVYPKGGKGLLAAAAMALVVVAGLAFLFRDLWLEPAFACWVFFKEPHGLARFVRSLGMWGPTAYILFQAAQVVLAPVPGEATGGFVAGVLFGPLEGFLYTMAGLIVGSMANFFLGRWLGEKVAARWVPRRVTDKFRFLLRPQGVLLSTLLFAIPQFPKDYFCLVLGWSRMPLKLFVPVMTIGRAPCTLLFVFKGSLLRQGHYYPLIALVVLVVAAAVFAYIYRAWLYRKLTALAGSRGEPEDGRQ
jgi:uncharacterized membrane protein YdjX (TVP38/TMEM64 family)